MCARGRQPYLNLQTPNPPQQEPNPPKDANEALLRNLDMEAMLQRAERLPDNRIVRFADLRPLVFDGLRNRDK